MSFPRGDVMCNLNRLVQDSVVTSLSSGRATWFHAAHTRWISTSERLIRTLLGAAPAGNVVLIREYQMLTRKGQWQPGQSGNSKGRPSIKGEVETLARTHTIEALETLVDLRRNGFPDSVRAAAANALLNRGWGLPRQAIYKSVVLSALSEPAVRRRLLRWRLRGNDARARNGPRLDPG